MADSYQSQSSMAVITRQDGPPAPPPLSPEYLSETLAPTLNAIVGTLVGICTLVFLLRVYVRTRMLRIFGPDDWLMLVAVVCKNCFRSRVSRADVMPSF
jgi:hypothetical protein